MDKLTLKKQSERYQGDIDLFNRMVIYKKNLQSSLSQVMNTQEKTKLILGQWNESLIPKMVILIDNYVNALNDEEDTLYALTKAGAVILSELDMPLFKTLDGHLVIYTEYLKYREVEDSEKVLLRLTMLAGL